MTLFRGSFGSIAKWTVPTTFSYPDVPMALRLAMSTFVTSARAVTAVAAANTSALSNRNGCFMAGVYALSGLQASGFGLQVPPWLMAQAGPSDEQRATAQS